MIRLGRLGEISEEDDLEPLDGRSKVGGRVRPRGPQSFRAETWSLASGGELRGDVPDVRVLGLEDLLTHSFAAKAQKGARALQAFARFVNLGNGIRSG